MEGTERYPWLDGSNERNYMSDREILEKNINLDNSCLTKWEKKEVRSLIYKYKNAFSMRDEIGTCPNIEIEIDVMDKSPFFIKPFHAREEAKILLDKEMEKIMLLRHIKGRIFSLFKPSHASEQENDKRQKGHDRFQALKYENSQKQSGLSSMKGHVYLVGSSKCEVLSVLDLKDEFHCLRLTESSEKYCGILPYFGSASYLYQRMPMGLNISPAVWQSYINAILSCLSSRKYCEAIMDDLLLFTPNKQSHFEELEDLLKALCKHGLKISPKKCHLFKTELQYMGNTIFIEDRHVCVKPLRSRLEAVQRLKPPVTPKGCKSFIGMVNFVSMFCPELQKLLKPIYDLTKKGKPFLWGKEQPDTFEEIKSRMQNPPVLSMPNRKGTFILYSDTSKLATGSVLYQFQDEQPRLIAYASKRMPEAAKNYSITELEMSGLAINIATFSHLLRKVDFDAVVDHLAIMKSKMEPAINRIKRLLEVLRSYSFNLYYIKGKDMVLSDFLSRQMGDKSNPHQSIPISFNIEEVLLKIAKTMQRTHSWFRLDHSQKV